MAMSKISSKVNLDVQTCALCSELYKSPKILPCLHTFCEPCVNDFIVSLGKRKEDKIVEFSCPLCRTCIHPSNPDRSYDQWAADLPENIVMKLMIARASDEEFPNCDVCHKEGKTSVSKYWCKTCAEVLCETCHGYHKRFNLLSSHNTEKLEEVGTNSGGIHVNAITTTCPRHPIHTIDFYCLSHECFGCCICKEVEHEKCKITPVKEMVDFCQSVPEKLEELKETFSNLLMKKQGHKEDLKIEVQKVEAEAVVFVERIKEQIDNSLENFKKQLKIFHEEENTKFNIRLRLLEQAMKDIQHWISTIGIVKELGTDEQLVIQTDVMKRQLKAEVEELFENLKFDATIKLDFEKDTVLMKVESSDNIGSIIQSKKALHGQLDDTQKCCLALDMPFKDLTLEYSKTIALSYYVKPLKCGSCIDISRTVVSSKGYYIRLNLVNKDTGTLISRSENQMSCERMYYYSFGNKIFTSNHGNEITVASLNDASLSKLGTFSCNSSPTGAMDYFDGHVYVATGSTIKRFDPSNTSDIEECCPTITDAGADGLKIFDGDVIFITKDNKVKRCSLDGKEVFSYSSPDIASPVSLIVLPYTGHVVVLDSKDGGKLHLLSVDGSRHVTILETFQQVGRPTDLWLGVDNNEIYVCGGEYIEIYKLL